MIRISPPARAFLLILAFLLLLPIVTIPSQDETQLTKFHNRTLSPWPSLAAAASDPTGYFKMISQSLADRVNPIIAASSLQGQILLYVLHTPPQKRVTLGPRGHIFLNSASDERVNELFYAECIDAHSELMIASLQRSIPIFMERAKMLQASIHFVITPTTSTLYADSLPDSVPRIFREACLKILKSGSPLEHLSHLNVIYPFAEMKSARGDDAFYPIANFHPTGSSVQLVREAYLKFTNRNGVVTDEALQPTYEPSEILSSYGIAKVYKRYVIQNAGLVEDEKINTALDRNLRDSFSNPPLTRVFVNSSGSSKGTALMLSDSFGREGSRAFAAAFKRLIWINRAGMKDGKIGQVIDEVVRLERVDSIILLFNEGGVGQINVWARDLAASK
jgi:hypothetical protein